MVAQAPDGINAAGVGAFLRGHGIGERLLDARLIAGGASNLTYTLTTEAGELVLRRPPLGHVLPTAHDMAREYRIISALAGSAVPVPRTYALCEDDQVTGAPFYLMERMHGVILAESIPAGYAAETADRARIGEALIETLAHLHAVDWRAAGLEGFGRPEGYLARQVRRWGEQWGRTRAEVGETPAIDELQRRLAAAVPPTPEPTIVHGDYRLGNVMLDAGDPGRIIAVLDWEMATLGDPLADLGYLAAFWLEQGDPPARFAAAPSAAASANPGFPTRDELVAMYGRRTGRDLSHFEFYPVLALYKLSVIVAGIYARYLAGETRGEGFERMENRLPIISELALDEASKSSIPALRGE